MCWAGGRKVPSTRMGLSLLVPSIYAVLSTPSQGKKKGGGTTVLVLGTGAGDVKAYDAQMGELKWRSRNVIEG